MGKNRSNIKKREYLNQLIDVQIKFDEILEIKLFIGQKTKGGQFDQRHFVPLKKFERDKGDKGDIFIKNFCPPFNSSNYQYLIIKGDIFEE